MAREQVPAEEFQEGKPPEEELPKHPRGLGVVRRPVPIETLQRSTKAKIAATVQEFRKRAMEILTSSGALEFAAEDAKDETTKRRKGPVGVGGTPLGPDRQREIRSFFNANGVDFMSRLMVLAVNDWELSLQGVLFTQALTAFNVGGNGARATLGIRGGFNLRNPFIVETLRDRANMLAGEVAEGTFERMKTVFAEGFYLNGESPNQVARTLGEEFTFLSRDRAKLIARTETLIITSGAQQETYKASGVEFKRWLTTLDGLERPSHFEAHGQLVPINEPFIVGTDELQYPGDPGGDISEIANCRCAHIAVVDAAQTFSSANVWAGDVAPDQFARERIAAAA